MIEIDKSKAIFNTTFILWFAVGVLAQTTIEETLGFPMESINRMLDVAVLIVLILQILMKRVYALDETIVSIVLLTVVSISGLKSVNYMMISLCLFVIAAKDVNVKTLVKHVYHILLGITFITIFMSLTGVIEDRIFWRSGALMRHSLGFSHPNVLGVVVFQIVYCYIILHENKLILQMIVTACGLVFDYLVPNSQSPMLLLALLLILLPINYFSSIRNEDDHLWFGKMLILGAFLCNILTIFVTVVDFRKYPLLNMLNLFTSTRFSANLRAFREYGISFLGQVVYTSEESRRLIGLEGHLYMDSAYTTLLIRYGILVFVVFSASYLAMMYMQLKKGRNLVIILLFVFAVYGITESSMFMLKYNFLLLYLSELLYNRDYDNVIGDSYQLE